jgi:hypothetical protein
VIKLAVPSRHISRRIARVVVHRRTQSHLPTGHLPPIRVPDETTSQRPKVVVTCWTQAVRLAAIILDRRVWDTFRLTSRRTKAFAGIRPRELPFAERDLGAVLEKGLRFGPSDRSGRTDRPRLVPRDGSGRLLRQI